MSETENAGLRLPETILSFQEETEFTNRVRRAAISRLITNPDNVTDPKVGGLLIKYLDGIDKQAFGRRRADALDAAAKGIGDMASALDKLVVNAGVGFTRPPEDNGDDVPLREVREPVLPDLNISSGVLDPVGTPVDVIKLMDEDLKKRRREQGIAED